MSKILISYRREDSADVAGRIYDRLVQKFGREAIFKDVDSIPFGVDFRTYLDEQVAKCEVFLAVIGRDWMKKQGSKGKSRLDDPGDFVRIEIESALKRQIPVIPVLVSGALIPSSEQLPASLQDLSYRQAIEVRKDPDFHQDMDRLIEHLKSLPSAAPGEAPSRSLAEAEQPIGAQARIPRVEVPPREAPFEMVKVLKGPFLYGEKRVREVIDHDFWIDTYTLTNEKYRAFILADGYGNQAYWSEEGWKWKTNHNKHTTPVTQYPNGVSLYGCYDMAGNVWEWCADRYDEARKDSRVLRGGSWYSNSESLRVSARGLGYVDSRSYDLGFRLVQDIP